MAMPSSSESPAIAANIYTDIATSKDPLLYHSFYEQGQPLISAGDCLARATDRTGIPDHGGRSLHSPAPGNGLLSGEDST